MRVRRHDSGLFPIARLRYVRPIPPLLIEANRLAAEGNYDQAAGIYERLADTALERQIPRAPYLFLHAGRASFFAQKSHSGAALLRKGLSLFAEQGRWTELQRSGGRMINFLTMAGFADEALELQSWIEISFPKLESDLMGSSPPITSVVDAEFTLPTQCPYCGAPVDPREVEQIDEDAVECLYCGNILRRDVR